MTAPLDEARRLADTRTPAAIRRQLRRDSDPAYRARERALALARARTRRLRVLTHYGGSCACCGEADEAFLCVDHIDGGGNAHRREIGNNVYPWLVTNDLPPGYQVLCANCNQAKDRVGGCPHARTR